MGLSGNSSTQSFKSDKVAHPPATPGAPVRTGTSIDIRFAQTAAPEKQENGPSRQDMADMVSAIAAVAAAYFALSSIRQVKALASATQLREAQLATLNLLTTGPASLGHLSKPLAEAIEKRSAAIAVFVLANGGTGNAADIEKAVTDGRLFDISAPFSPAMLEKFGDWYGAIADAAERAAFATFFNKLEETSTNVLRGTLDLRVLDKAYGTLIRSTYQEASQAIYYHRRSSSYRQFDQLERVVDLLRESASELYRPPGLFLGMFWLLTSKRRKLVQYLGRYSSRIPLDGGQLEGALIASDLLYEETKFRARLQAPADRFTFQSARRTWRDWSRGSSAPRETFVVVRKRHREKEKALAIIVLVPVHPAATIVVGNSAVPLEPLLRRLPSRLFKASHLRERTQNGAFSGPESIYCWQVPSAVLQDAEALQACLRVMKRELNTGRLRPFLLSGSGGTAEMSRAQQVIYGEGGLLLFADVAAGSVEAIWLF